MEQDVSGILNEILLELAPLAIALFVVATIIIIFSLIRTIRTWRSQAAIFEMQKDINEIKQRLASNNQDIS